MLAARAASAMGRGYSTFKHGGQRLARFGLVEFQLAEAANCAGGDRRVLMLGIIRDQHHGHAGGRRIGLELCE